MTQNTRKYLHGRAVKAKDSHHDDLGSNPILKNTFRYTEIMRKRGNRIFQILISCIFFLKLIWVFFGCPIGCGSDVIPFYLKQTDHALFIVISHSYFVFTLVFFLDDPARLERRPLRGAPPQRGALSLRVGAAPRDGSGHLHGRRRPHRETENGDRRMQFFGVQLLWFGMLREIFKKRFGWLVRIFLIQLKIADQCSK